MCEDSKDGLDKPAITFSPMIDKPEGYLFLDPDGKLRFEGDMTESAKIFFEGFLKPACNDYIKERLEKAKETLRKYGRHLRSCELVKQPYLPSTDSHWVCTCGFSEAMNCQLCHKEGYVVDLPLPKGGYTTRHCPKCGAI